MSFRRTLALALLILAAGGERFAYYGARQFAFLDLARDMSRMDSAAVFSAISWGMILASFLGAGLTLKIGPRVTAAIACGISALGLLVLAAANAFTLGWVIVAIGAGMFRVCIYAAGAEIVESERDVSGELRPSRRRFAAMATFTLAAYAIIHMSAMSAAPLMGAARNLTHGRGLALGIGVAVVLIAAAFAASAEIVCRMDARAAGPARSPANDPYRAPVNGATTAASTPIGPPHASAPALKGVAILAIGAAIFSVGSSLDQPPSSLYGASNLWIFSVHPILVILASIAAFVVFLIATMNRSAMPPLLMFGIGLVVVGVGFVLILAAGRESVIGYSVGAAVVGVGEAGIPIATAYAALAVRGRGGAMVLAVWMGATSVVGLSVGQQLATLRNHDIGNVLLGIAGVTALVCGCIFAAKASKLHALFDVPEPPPPPPPP